MLQYKKQKVVFILFIAACDFAENKALGPLHIIFTVMWKNTIPQFTFF